MSKVKKLDGLSLIAILGRIGLATLSPSTISTRKASGNTKLAASPSKKEFVSKVYKAAKNNLSPDIPPSLAVAQAVHETGWGTQRMTTECGVSGCYKTRQPFKDFPSVEASIPFYDKTVSRILRSQGYSTSLFRENPDKAINVLSRKYATDPNYSRLIKRTMNQIEKMEK
jgi:flagellum-specific peptidoglycan hydrolase FlgJ